MPPMSKLDQPRRSQGVGPQQALHQRRRFGLAGHLGQDEVSGAIDNSSNALHSISYKALIQRFDNGNAHTPLPQITRTHSCSRLFGITHAMVC